MIFLFIITFLLGSLFLGKYIFEKNINPIAIYSMIWSGMLFFFHLKLINYDGLSFYAWFLIIFAYLSFIMGCLTFYSGKSIYNNSPIIEKKNFDLLQFLFHKNGSILRFLILFFSGLGLIGALQHWSVLLNKYGSIVEVFLHLGRIRQLTVSGEIEGILPYISAFSYTAVFFAGIYSAWKRRITLISFLPLLAIILKDTAAAGRVGILIGFLQYGLTYFFTSYFLKINPSEKENNLNVKGYLSVIVVVIIFFTSIFMIKGLRGGSEQLHGAGRNINTLSNNLFITPTLYLYFSGHIGVLSKYLEKDDETARFGENSFRFVYNVLNKLGVTDDADMYQRGYYIPVWINTGTFLRELHADFGIGGTLIFLFVLGIIISYIWWKFFDYGNPIVLAFLVYLSLIISLSFLMMITRLTNWSISLLSIIIILFFWQRVSSYQIENSKL